MDHPRCHIRKSKQNDWTRLEEIYRSQEGAALPEGYFADFQETIRNPDILFLVAEAEGRVVGGGGVITYWPGKQISLTFGIVHASECRKGFGTDILLSRLVSFTSAEDGCEVLVEATEWSANFFRNLGSSGTTPIWTSADTPLSGGAR